MRVKIIIIPFLCSIRLAGEVTKILGNLIEKILFEILLKNFLVKNNKLKFF